MKRNAFASCSFKAFSCWLFCGVPLFRKKGAFSAVNFFDGTPPSRQVDGARTQGTLFFFGGGGNLFTRQVGKWRWEDGMSRAF